jgi:hypothetical protein
MSDEELWDDRYRESDRIWSGNPNTVLVREVEGMVPGRALDLACGEGADDLVSAHFLHSPGDMPREKILRTAAGAVAPGGMLLVVGHAGFPPWEDDPHPGVHLPTPQEVLEDLDLPDKEWEVLVCEEHERIQNDPGGRPVTRTDNALKVRRRDEKTR